MCSGRQWTVAPELNSCCPLWIARLCSRLLVFTWSSSNFCEHSGNETADQISLCLSLCLSLSFSLSSNFFNSSSLWQLFSLVSKMLILDACIPYQSVCLYYKSYATWWKKIPSLPSLDKHCSFNNKTNSLYFHYYCSLQSIIKQHLPMLSFMVFTSSWRKCKEMPFALNI